MEHIEEITDDQLRNLLKYIFERSGTKISHSLEEVVEMLKKAEEFIKGRYKIKESMADIGSRLQKYWMEIEETEIERGQREKKSYILSISKFSSICPLGSREEVSEKMDILSKLLGVLNKHPNVYEIKEVAVERVEKIDADAVIIIQTKNPGGSLRDKISGCEEDEFMNSWSQKRNRTDSSVEFHDVLKTYAIQILEGMLFLKKIGFGYLGNIHLGNIYLIKSANAEEDVSANAAKDVCQISGHENTLFGYRTGIFEEVVRKPEFLKYMDVIMFGHILYGLAKGKQLKEYEVFPSEEQLESIKNRELKKLLKYVFERSNKKMKHSLEDILNKLEGIKWFHRKTSRDFMKGVDETSITEEMKELLSKIKP